MKNIGPRNHLAICARFLMASALIAMAQPVLAQAQPANTVAQYAQSLEGRGSQDPNYAMLHGMAIEAGVFDFIALVSNPLLDEAQVKINGSNPDKANEVEEYMKAERVRYHNMILDAAVSIGVSSLGRGDNPFKLYDYARTDDGKKVTQLFGGKDAMCYLLPESLNLPECASAQRALTDLRLAKNPNRKRLFNSLTAITNGALVMITMSTDSGDPMALIERETLEAAGLTWPGKRGE